MGGTQLRKAVSGFFLSLFYDGLKLLSLGFGFSSPSSS
uniref:Uncharacterized protein n=1 Tax=Anopheles albimanus TaxID=7167 RepID=A0A182FXN4_ANOAL